MDNDNYEQQRDELLNVLKGIRTFVEDGNVVELRPCGFIDELQETLKKYKDECDDDCLDHSPSCDGFCDHIDHQNTCML